MRLLFQGKVEVVAEYEDEIRTVSISVRLPSILRLLHYVKVQRTHQTVKFTRSNLYARDEFRCQYCAAQPGTQQLTYDHVMPVARGGTKTWENIVTCCVACNRRKGNRTPEEAGLRLLRRPRVPSGFPHKIRFQFQQRKAPEVWKTYAFWNLDVSID